MRPKKTQTLAESERKACNEFPALAMTAQFEHNDDVSLSVVQRTASCDAGHQTIDCEERNAGELKAPTNAYDAISHARNNGSYMAYCKANIQIENPHLQRQSLHQWRLASCGSSKTLAHIL